VTVLGIWLAAGLPAAHADGTLDTSFAGTGQLALDAAPTYDESVQAMTEDSQGRLLVVATATYEPTGYTGAFVIRFLEDGTVDQTFSVGDDDYGSGIKAVGEVNSLRLQSIALDSQGRIVLGGTIEQSPTDWDLLITRLLPDGAYDESLGYHGAVTHDLSGGTNDGLRGLKFDSQGRLLGYGTIQATGHPPQGFVARFTEDGALDTTFNGFGNGWFTPFFNDAATTGVADVEEDQAGKILISGNLGERADFLTIRLNDDGSIDQSFAGGGVATPTFPGGENQGVTSINVDSGNRIYLTGAIYNDEGSGSIGVVRLLPDGTHDQSFGTEGFERIDFEQRVTPDDAAIDSFGRLVIQGITNSEDYSTVDGLFTRVKTDGSLDQSFGQNGFVRESRPDRRMYMNTMLIDDKGRYLMAGSERQPDDSDQVAISRYDADYSEELPPPPPPSSRKAKCLGKKATIIGTSHRDVLKGTRKRDVIAGLGRNDVIKGLAGNDLICGGAGKDKLIGGPGKDTLLGGPGNDVLIGGPGKDKLLGGPGKDKVKGGPGKDKINGGAGKDRCLAGPGKGRLVACERRR
jgi:uncharacterized delta-60 repeat protein